MTKEEVLHKLEYMRDAYQKLIDENVSEGGFVGDGITGTWKSDTPLNKVYAEHVEALDMAISALKKQEDDVKPTICFKNGFYYATKNGVKVASWEPLINTYNAKEYQNET